MQTDIYHKVLVIGSGPIIIGQAAEFDYAGVQVCRLLRKEGIEIVLVNSNPATIMTDTDIADRVYIEPLCADTIEKIINKEKPDAMLAAFGGQTSLNIACELYDKGVLDKYKVKLLGTDIESIKNSEDRKLFKTLMQSIGEPILESNVANNSEEAFTIAEKIGYPVVIRPAYTLGGKGGSFVNSSEELQSAVTKGINSSPVNQVLIEKSVYGYKEIEFEVIRDKDNDRIVVCTMENVDSMGIHTGDSIVVAPAQTLSENLLGKLRKSAFNIISALAIEGCCNIQFAVNPKDENEYYVIEVNPRASRSSALASKATGFPIAKVAAKLALGYKLTDFDKDTNKLEPKPDYVVVKIPKFSFNKFKNIDRRLTTHMKSTGEVMAIGKTLEEAFAKGLESVESEFNTESADYSICDDLRIYRIINALNSGISSEEISKTTSINKYFIDKLKNIKNLDKSGETYFYEINPHCDKHSANSYFYSSKYKYDSNVVVHSGNKKILVIGSGPIRIGQGIEFDYCSVHAVKAIKKLGYDAVLLNSNPETLSTDYDVSTRLYFEPITPEYVKHVIDFEKPDGIVVQFGGQTAINILESIKEYPIIGTQYDSINMTEDRIEFNNFLDKLNIPQPKSFDKVQAEFPVSLRPSYTIGGFGVQIAYNREQFDEIMKRASSISAKVLIDEYIEGLECEADIISDGENILFAGPLEHIERTGIHSGDSIAVYPSQKITQQQKQTMLEYSLKICRALNIKGLINIQFIISKDKIYVLEVNPRASRTVPILSKMTGYPICETAINIMLGAKLSDIGILEEPNSVAVKMPIFSFEQLECEDTALVAEMKSTGEVLGIDNSYEKALFKAFLMRDTNFFAENHFSCKDTEHAFEIAKQEVDNVQGLSVKEIADYTQNKLKEVVL